nr:MAG TPA: hypothetical protein [Bacteriophage sp.]
MVSGIIDMRGVDMKKKNIKMLYEIISDIDLAKSEFQSDDKKTLYIPPSFAQNWINALYEILDDESINHKSKSNKSH